MPKARNLASQSMPTVQWTLVGPDRTVNADQSKSPDQTNVYSISQCLRNPSVVYCGTEPGEIYKSTNAGQQWNLVTLNDPLNGGVTAICVHPQDPNHVLAGSGDYLFRSTDGGGTWQNVLTVAGLGVTEIHRDSQRTLGKHRQRRQLSAHSTQCVLRCKNKAGQSANCICFAEQSQLRYLFVL
jgi:hypothetical protein